MAAPVVDGLSPSEGSIQDHSDLAGGTNWIRTGHATRDGERRFDVTTRVDMRLEVARYPRGGERDSAHRMRPTRRRAGAYS
jgi:hypothetical protein